MQRGVAAARNRHAFQCKLGRELVRAQRSLCPRVIIWTGLETVAHRRALPLQRTTHNRVGVRLDNQHFVPTVDNYEAEIQCGLAFRGYCSSAPAVRIDRVRPCDLFEPVKLAILASRYVSAYHSFSRRVDPE